MKIFYNNLSNEKNFDLKEDFKSIDCGIYSILDNLSALRIIQNNNLLLKTIQITEEFKNHKSKFVIFGTGGSNLGARALVNITNNQNIEFYDNIDPVHFENSFKNIDIQSTGFIIISKSGSTPETLSQLGAIIQISKEKKQLDKFYSNTLIITESKPSPLYNIAKKNNCSYLEHQKDIGVRFSVFSPVGMVPSILSGLNVQKIHEGAKSIYENYKQNNLSKIGKLFKFQHLTDFRNNVIMTYSDSLYYFGKWYLQLWAESIGKDKKGITAIHSIGTTDQHSQLQLYLNGPRDKFFTFITTDHFNKGLKIDSDVMDSQKLDYLSNKKMGDLMQAEQRATIETFKKNNFQFREIYIPKINEYYLGALMALSIIETVYSCIYFDVNPFDQPAVEYGKKLAIKYLKES